jgi:hypothetical protein
LPGVLFTSLQLTAITTSAVIPKKTSVDLFISMSFCYRFFPTLL